MLFSKRLKERFFIRYSIEDYMILKTQTYNHDMGFISKDEKNYANHLGIADDNYRNIELIYDSKQEVLNLSNLIIKVNCPSEDEINILKENTILIGMFNPSKNKSK